MFNRRLTDRIREAGLTAPVARTFRRELGRVALVEGPIDSVEGALIEQLVEQAWTAGVSPAPFEALWGFGEVFLEACLHVAVADGDYTVRQARHVSQLAHKLGYSARQLANLESDVLNSLACRPKTGSRRVYADPS